MHFGVFVFNFKLGALYFVAPISLHCVFASNDVLNDIKNILSHWLTKLPKLTNCAIQIIVLFLVLFLRFQIFFIIYEFAFHAEVFY